MSLGPGDDKNLALILEFLRSRNLQGAEEALISELTKKGVEIVVPPTASPAAEKKEKDRPVKVDVTAGAAAVGSQQESGMRSADTPKHIHFAEGTDVADSAEEGEATPKKEPGSEASSRSGSRRSRSGSLKSPPPSPPVPMSSDEEEEEENSAEAGDKGSVKSAKDEEEEEEEEEEESEESEDSPTASDDGEEETVSGFPPHGGSLSDPNSSTHSNPYNIDAGTTMLEHYRQIEDTHLDPRGPGVALPSRYLLTEVAAKSAVGVGALFRGTGRDGLPCWQFDREMELPDEYSDDEDPGYRLIPVEELNEDLITDEEWIYTEYQGHRKPKHKRSPTTGLENEIETGTATAPPPPAAASEPRSKNEATGTDEDEDDDTAEARSSSSGEGSSLDADADANGGEAEAEAKAKAEGKHVGEETKAKPVSAKETKPEVKSETPVHPPPISPAPASVKSEKIAAAAPSQPQESATETDSAEIPTAATVAGEAKVESSEVVPTPKSQSTTDAAPPEEDTIFFDCFDLKIVYERQKTGFEEQKDFPIKINSIIAGRYQILQFLGSAAFSNAVQCIDLHDLQYVCIKIIKNNKDFFDQSLDEIKLLKFINANDPDDSHNVLQLYDYFYFKEHLFIVTELLRENLYEFSKFNRESEEERYFTMPRLQKVTRQCMEALSFVHSLGLIHCDLKPENILIRSYSRCEIKVIDFGSSCYTTDHLTSYVQSRSYRAPEVILGMQYGTKIDMWSMGCIVAELWTGNVLFHNDSIATLLGRVAGIVGPFSRTWLRKGKYANRYFTRNLVLYERNPEDPETIVCIVPKKTTLKERLHIEDDLFLDFVTQLLQVDPEKRLSAEEALRHPWLHHKYPDVV